MNSNIQQSINQSDLGELNFEVLKKIRGYLRRMIDAGGSDLHIKANAVVRARINGEIIPLSGEIFSKDDALVFAKELLRTRFPELVEKKELDLVYPFDENTRFRINIFFQMEGISAVFRLIPVKILTVDELLLPQVVHTFAEMERGLVLVTGVTGSGKSTTLAALINEINWKRRKHIITIEDPIEFVFKNKESLIEQREIGVDTHSFAEALKHVLRQDPNIILVGEMRDPETIATVLTAAETGHLVFSTLHTSSAAEAVERIVDVFDGAKQKQILIQLGSVLRGIVAQQLIETTDGKRVAAREILVNTPASANLIKENNIAQLRTAIQTGAKDGMITMENSVKQLVHEGLISAEVAEKRVGRQKKV